MKIAWIDDGEQKYEMYGENFLNYQELYSRVSPFTYDYVKSTN